MQQGGADRANQIARSGLLLAGLAGCGFLLTIGWNLSIAALFGTSAELDAFWIGFAIPKAVADSFHLGILTLLFVLVFNLHDRNGSTEDPWELLSSVFNVVLLITSLLIVLALFGAPLLVKLMGPGLDADLQARSAGILRELSLLMIPTAFVGLFAGVLHANQRFFPFAMSRVAGLSIQIAVLFLLASRMNVRALVWAVILGSLVMVFVCLPAFLRIRSRYSPRILIRTPGARTAFRLFLALGAAALLDRANQVSDRFFASGLGEGFVSSLEFAWRFEIPVSQVLSLSIALPSFALMALQASEDGLREFRKTLVIGVRLVALFVVPVVGYLLVLRDPITSLWFQRGMFSAESSARVASLVPALAVIFCLKSFATLMVFALLSLHKVKQLLGILALEVITHTALNAILVGPLGLQGIVIAGATAALLSNSWLWFLLLRSMGGWSLASFGRGAWKTVTTSAGAVGFLWIAHLLWPVMGAVSGQPSIAPYLAVIGILYLVFYVALCRALGLIEIGARGGLPRIRLRPSEWGAVP